MSTAVLAKQQLQETIGVLETSLPDASEADCIEILQLVEQAKRKLAAVQAQATHALIEQRDAAEAEDGIPKSKRLGGVDAEVGLARGESPFIGAALTRLATALCSVLPHTLTALRVGRVSEYHARIVAEQTTHLSEAHRRKIDELIAHRLGKASSSQLRKLIEGHALRLDREAAEQRAAVNKAQRRVWMEPAGDGTSYLTAQVATHDAVAIMDVLHQRANQRRIEAAADNPDAPLLSHNQIQADLFVELLTGQLPGPGVTAEVMVLMEDTTLFGDDDQPAWIPGHGPVPAGIIKDCLADPTVKACIRRMYTRPADGQLVAMESRRRAFPTGLAKMLKLRDDTCATPFCNNPVEEADHRTPWAKGGTTSWDNATGLCRRCNQRKENRGWRYSGTPDELTVATPTGHQYTVPTLPPLTQLRPNSSDPPTSSDSPSTSDPPPPGVVIDIAHPTTKITWRLAA